MASDWPLLSTSVLACPVITNKCVSLSKIRQKLKFRFGSMDETATAVAVPGFDVVDKLEVWVRPVLRL